MSASVGPSSVSSPGLTPGIWTTGTTPPMIIGNWVNPEAANSSLVSGLSDAPNVTVDAWICLIPPPEPID